MENLVTIGIPVYNAERYVYACLSSVLAQTHSVLEIIVVNDGSTDNSWNIVRQFEDNRIKLINDGLKLGLPTRLNQISKLAKGSYIARMDADDIMHPDRVSKQLNLLLYNPKVDVVGCNYFSMNENSEIIGCRFKFPRLNAVGSFSTSEVLHPSMMASKRWFLSNPYDEIMRRSQDRELWLRVHGTAIIECLNAPLMVYREGESYYRKYLTGLKSILYLVKKRMDISSMLFLLRYILVSVLYTLAHCMNMESSLIKRRSATLKENFNECHHQYLGSCENITYNK